MNLREHRIAIAVVVLIALIAAAYALKSRQDAGTPTASGEPTASLPDLRKDDIRELEIKRPEDQVPTKLARVDGTWRVVGPVSATADSSAVDTALEKLDELVATGIAATRRENHERLEVDEAHGVRVIVRGENRVLADLIFGAYRSGATVVREREKDVAMLAEGSLKFAFNKALKDWRDKTITDVAADAIGAIAFERPEATFRFRRNGTDWVAEEGSTAVERFQGSRVASTISTFARMRAVDFGHADLTPQQAGITAESPVVRLSVASDAGPQEIVLRLGSTRAGETNEVYLERVGAPGIFLISRFTADRMRPEASAFQEPPDAGRPPTPPTPPPGSAVPQQVDPSQLPPEIMQQLQRQLQQQGAAN